MITYDDLKIHTQAKIDLAISEVNLLIECIRISINNAILQTQKTAESHYYFAKIYDVASTLDNTEIKAKLALAEQQILAILKEFEDEMLPLNRI